MEMDLNNNNRHSCCIFICTFLLAAGCSTNVSRFQMPGTDLAQIQTFYLAPSDDERSDSELQSLIESNLETRGYKVVLREPSTIFTRSDFIFDFVADWHWDVTWYLLDLRVAIYDPTNDTLIAQAQSHQASLARKSIETIVDRAIASLFNDSQETNGEE